MRRTTLYISIMAALLSGCTMIPAYQRPDVKTPAEWKNADAVQAPQNATPIPLVSEWWQRFGNEQLNELIQLGLKNNTDINASLARIEQARAGVTISRSSLFPSLDASANAGRNDTNKSKASTDYRVGASAAYEVDLFGRNRSGLAGAIASFNATAYDHEALKIVVTTEIAQAYFDILNLREQLRISTTNLAIQKDVLDIVQARFREGLNSQLEVSQQNVQYANSSAALTEQQRALDARENSLAVLLGIAPSELKVEGDDLTVIALQDVYAPIPSSLLEARPDIKAAEESLKAADADIGAARAAFFPTINLGASLTALFDPTIFANSLSASMLAPIFHGGALSGSLELSEARQRELVENYRKTVLTSFQEVEDALAFIRSANMRQVQLFAAYDEAHKAYELAHEQYTAGAIDFQALLDAQRSMLSSDTSYAQAKLDVLSASLALIKATGAGWKPESKAP